MCGAIDRVCFRRAVCIHECETHVWCAGPCGALRSAMQRARECRGYARAAGLTLRQGALQRRSRRRRGVMASDFYRRTFVLRVPCF